MFLRTSEFLWQEAHSAYASAEEAREQTMWAATLAGIAFGNAGVHIPHAMAYAVAGQVREFRPSGYPDDKPLVPHGMSVILNAPAAFRVTAAADPAGVSATLTAREGDWAQITLPSGEVRRIPSTCRATMP